MVPRHRSPLEPPNLLVKAALMEAEVEAVTDGDRNRGGWGNCNSNSDNGSGRQQQGQATIINMPHTMVGGGGGERWQTKMRTAVAIAAAMAEEAVVATAVTAATVAEAMAAETERQNSGAGLLSLADVVCRTVLLGKQWQYFSIFFSVCMCKQIICETDMVRILAFAFFNSANTIGKYKNVHFVSLSAYRGNKITLFWQKRLTNSQCDTKKRCKGSRGIITF
jgi:hypothetical protein